MSDWLHWGPHDDVQFQVLISGAGPFDHPFTAPFFDVTHMLRGESGISIKRGRSDEFTTFQAGTCSFELKNDNREFDPSNLDSPYIDVLKPLRRVAVIVQYDGQQEALFTGFIDGWPRGWTKTTGTVQISAKDQISVMARTQTTPSLGVLVFDHPDDGKWDKGRFSGDLTQQFSGERVESLLQLAGFGAASETLNIARGLTEVVAVAPTGNVLSLIQEAERAEAGFFFIDKDGFIQFLDRHSRFQESRIGDVQAVFTDRQYQQMAVDHNLTQVWNDVAFTRPDGMEQRVVDDESVHDYGYLSLRQQIPVVSDGETLSRSEFYVARYGTPQDRPAPIVVSVRKDIDNLLLAVAGRELLDRIQVQRTPLGVGDTVTFTGLIESIEHKITNDSWTATFGTSPIDVSEGDDFLVLDDPILGELDSHTFAY